MHGKQTLNARKNGKVERYMDVKKTYSYNSIHNRYSIQNSHIEDIEPRDCNADNCNGCHSSMLRKYQSKSILPQLTK